jgi:hypothetical protein
MIPPPRLVLVAAGWSPFVLVFPVTMPPEVQQMAEQHQYCHHNEETVALEKLAHRNPPL